MDQPLSFTINLLCHVWILLTFLTLFFFNYVTNLTEEHVDHEMKSIMEDQTFKFMTFIDNLDTERVIQWQAVNNVATNLMRDSNSNVQSITDNNAMLHDNAICALYMLLLLIFILAIYFWFRGVDLKLKFILLENLVIFTFVGMIEVYFFLNIASKYIPILPDDAMKAIFARLRSKLA